MFGYLHLLLIVVVLLSLNEIFRRSKWATLVFFGVLPVVLTGLVWIKTANVEGASTNTWFHWAKLYSVIIAVLGFTAMRFTKWGEHKLVKFFPALVLGVNIAEAVARDFQLGLENGGIWHFLNGSAGILSIITICGWQGIYTEKSKIKDLLWPDMTTFWIIAYDIWNFAYIWFCVPIHAAFGFMVLLSCTIPSLLIKKGTWVQARAFTLATWMMYVFTFTAFIDNPTNQVVLPSNPKILLAVGLLSFAANLAFALIHFKKKLQLRAFGFGQPVHVTAHLNADTVLG